MRKNLLVLSLLAGALVLAGCTNPLQKDDTIIEETTDVVVEEVVVEEVVTPVVEEVEPVVEDVVIDVVEEGDETTVPTTEEAQG